MNNLISKLNTLKSIEPEENWVVETRKRVLSEAPVLGWKMTEVRNKRENGVADKFFSRRRTDEALPRLYGGYTALFSKRLAVSAFALVFLVSGGAFTFEASKSSLPGDSLYIVKIASEDITLAVASKEKRPEIEIDQAGKRLAELAEISKKPSYDDQSKKTEQLLASFERKISNAQNGLIEIENNGVKAKVAKVINIQTEKYTEVLAETKENLPDTVKDEILLEKFASVTKSNEKVNFESLTIMVETIDENEEEEKEEITAKVKEEINKLEEIIIINDESKEVEDNTKTESVKSDDENSASEEPTDTADESADIEEVIEDLAPEPIITTEEAEERLESYKAMEAIISVNIAVNLIDSETEPDSDPAGDEPTEDGTQGDGEVEGVSDEVEGDEGGLEEESTYLEEGSLE